MNKQIGLVVFTALILSACSSMPSNHQPSSQKAAPISESGGGAASGGYLEGDGPGSDIPANLDQIPDAVPRAEPLHPYANRPYTALGRTYTPLTKPGNYKERGIASWYGKKFHGQRTSSGEVYDMYGMTAAHPTLPIPSYARVTNLKNGKSVVVRINDRGPFMHDRIIDLSYAAAYKLGLIANGSGEVEVESLVPGQQAPAVAEPVKSEPLPPAPVQATVAASGNVYLQLGAFRSHAGAESFLAKMRAQLGDAGTQHLTLFMKDGLTRVHLGPYASKDAAVNAASGLQGKLGFKPVVRLH